MFSWLLNKLSRQAPLHPKGIFLGSAAIDGTPLVLDDRALRSHVALSGRGGQGRTVMLQQMLTQQTVEGRGWVHIDPSGDGAWRDQIAHVASMAGRLDDFYVLDLVDPTNSNTYDVLRAGTAESRAQRVLTVFPDADDAGAEQFHLQVGALLAPLFEAIDATGRSAGLLEVAELLAGLGSLEVREQLISAIPEGHPAAAAFTTALDALLVDGWDAQRLTAVGEAAADRLEMLVNLKGSRIVNHPQPELDFEDVLAGGKMCLVRLSPVEQACAAGLLARMVVQDISSAMLARAGMPSSRRTPFLVALDAFPEYGLSDAVNAPLNSSAWAHARGLNVSLVPVVNSGNWDRLHAQYGTEAFTGNTRTKVYFQQADSEQLAKQHAELQPGALSALQPGQFLMCQGDAVVAGKLPYTSTGTSPSPFKKQPMPGIAARPRLTLPPVHRTP